MIWRSLCVGIALIVATMLPFSFSGFTLTIAINALVFSIFAVSLNVVVGSAGLPSLGHAAFFGTGAYAVGLLVQSGIRNVLFAVVLAIVIAGALAVVLGPILLRTRGTYFLMATLAVGEVMRNLAVSWRSVTNGDDGLYGIRLPPLLADQRSFYFFLLLALVVIVAAVAVLMRSPFGHTVLAVRDNRSRASVLGIDPLRVELSVFLVGATIAGFAGAMFAYAKGFVSPGVLSVETSADALLMVVLGGPGTLFGPVVGAVLIEAIRGIGSTYTARWLTILGVLACLVALDPRRYLAHWTAFRGRTAMAESPSELYAEPSAGPVAAAPLARAVVSRTAPPVLQASGIAKRFGGLAVLNDISLSVAAGERRGLIGPNGAGKTTFLNILSGLTRPTGGRVRFLGQDVTARAPFERARLGIGRTFQIANLFNDSTVCENLVLALLARDRHGFDVVRPLGRYSALQDEASRLLDEWGLRPWESVPVKLLAYGQRRRVEIALAVAQRPKLILLDEPAAGLSGRETKAIIQTISALDPQLSLLIVEHDMDLVFSVCDSVTVIANGRVLAEGEGDTVRRDKNVIEAYLGMPL